MLRDESSGFRVQGSGVKDHGSIFSVWVWASRFRDEVQGLGFKVYGSESRV